MHLFNADPIFSPILHRLRPNPTDWRVHKADFNIAILFLNFLKFPNQIAKFHFVFLSFASELLTNDKSSLSNGLMVEQVVSVIDVLGFVKDAVDVLNGVEEQKAVVEHSRPVKRIFLIVKRRDDDSVAPDALPSIIALELPSFIKLGKDNVSVSEHTISEFGLAAERVDIVQHIFNVPTSHCAFLFLSMDCSLRCFRSFQEPCQSQ